MDLSLIVLMLVCLAVSFGLSGMEAGVFALDRLRVRQQLRAGNPRAKVLHAYLEDPEDFLWTILVGNTLANVIIFSIGVMALYFRLWRWPVLLIGSLAAGVLVFYALCELLPKMLFRLYPNRLCMSLALPFRVVHLVLKPLVAPMALMAGTLLRWSGGKRFTGHLFASREELRLMMQESAKELTSEEQVMINRVLDLQKLRVGQIAVPIAKVVSVSVETPLREVLAIARERGLSRLPVWKKDGGRQRVVGVVTLAPLLFQEGLEETKTAGEYLKPALFVDAELRLESALRQMQRTGQRLAIVLAPDRTELGVASLQDILKVIFGEVTL